MDTFKKRLAALSMGVVAAAGTLAAGTAGSASAATADNPCDSKVYEFCVFQNTGYEGDFFGVRWGQVDGYVPVPGTGQGQISSVINNTNYQWNLYDSHRNVILVVGKFYWLSSLGNADNKTAAVGIIK